ncbi:MAG: hypothetical protein ACQCN6_14115 [Candidatus Bathyarchaeia archaeon]
MAASGLGCWLVVQQNATRTTNLTYTRSQTYPSYFSIEDMSERGYG